MTSLSRRRTSQLHKLERMETLELLQTEPFAPGVGHCQALYGVHSKRLNSVYSKLHTTPIKTLKWAVAVRKVTEEQLEEVSEHLETTLLPNPFAPRGLKENSCLPP